VTTAHGPERINTLWADAFNARDVPAMLALYEGDAVMVPAPGSAPVTGPGAIESSLQRLVGLGGRLTFQPRYWLRNGDLALGRIDFRLAGGTDNHGATIDLRGSTAEVTRRQPDGTWKYVFDHPFGANPT